MSSQHMKHTRNDHRPWYKQWWIWLIAALVVAGIVVTCILVANMGKNNDDSGKLETTAGTTIAPSTEATTIPATTVAKSIDDIIKEGYTKVGIGTLYSELNKYKGKKIITAVQVKDVGENALYATLESGGKPVAYYRFVFTDDASIKDAKKGDYFAVYGTVNKNGTVANSIEIDGCQVAAKGDEAKKFLNSIKDVKPTEPSTAPTKAPTTVPATTAPVTQPTTVSPTQPTTTTDVPVTSPDDRELYNDNDIVVTLTDSPEADFSNGVHVLVRNNSDLDLFFSAKDCTINGVNFDLMGWESIGNGTNCYTTLYVSKSALLNAGITSIDDMRFKLVFEDANDEGNVITSDEISLINN